MKDQYQTGTFSVSRPKEPGSKFQARATMTQHHKAGDSGFWLVTCYLNGVEIGKDWLLNTRPKVGPVNAATNWVKKCLAGHFSTSPGSLEFHGNIHWTAH